MPIWLRSTSLPINTAEITNSHTVDSYMPIGSPQIDHVPLDQTISTLLAVKQTLRSLFHIERLDIMMLTCRSLTRFFTQWRKYIEHTFTADELSYIIYPFRYTDWYLKCDLTNTLGKLKIKDRPNSSNPLSPRSPHRMAALQNYSFTTSP